MNEEERARVRSYDTWTVTNQEEIKTFARLISQGTYRGDLRGSTEAEGVVTAYRGRRRQVKFAMRYTTICTDRQIVFGYPADSLTLAVFDPPELQPLRMRWNCCSNLSTLFVTLMQGMPRGHLYPDPNHWCDIIAARIRDRSPDARIAGLFACPSAQPSLNLDDARSQAHETDPSNQTPGAWMSTYAMNPSCSEDSPRDVVFLFESQPGWNQHGGPELFTFDNHDPKGGLVLLNDGTVKFIRTEEELKQLRWK
ncbi:MAG: hypothetical protein M1376_08215 [Planctomycetes bacterium]|nr:hypothetical protein [Planctomycetota bacterium]